MSESRMYLAICGHEKDLSKVFESEFALLSVIASRRHEGIIQGDLTKVTGQDKRSVPRRTDVLQQKGYIVKRAIHAPGSKTSQLILTKFAQTLKKQNATGDVASPQHLLQTKETSRVVDIKKLTVKLFDLLHKRSLMTRMDIKFDLDMVGLWHTRILSRLIRVFEALQCLKRVKARSEASSNSYWTYSCVKFIRFPTEEEMQMQAAPNSSIASLALSATEPQEDSDDDDAGVEANNTHSKTEESRGVLTEVQRVVPQWNPDRPVSNLIYQIIYEAGLIGISTPSIRRLTVGDFNRKPVERLMILLTRQWAFSSTPDRRHLNLIRDTVVSGHAQHYSHWTFDNFQTLVVQGTSFWEGVISNKPAVQGKLKTVKTSSAVANSDHSPLLDEFGFPKGYIPDRQHKNGDCTIGQCLREAKVGEYATTYRDPKISPDALGNLELQLRSMKGKNSSLQKTERQSRPLITQPLSDQQVEDLQTPPIPGESLNADYTKHSSHSKTIGRTRKYARGLEKFWRNMYANAISESAQRSGKKVKPKQAGYMNNPIAVAMYNARPTEFDETVLAAIDAGLPYPDRVTDVSSEWVERTRSILYRSSDGVYISPKGAITAPRGQDKPSQILILRTSRLHEVEVSRNSKILNVEFLSSSIGQISPLYSMPKAIIKGAGRSNLSKSKTPAVRFLTSSVAHTMMYSGPMIKPRKTYIRRPVKAASPEKKSLHVTSNAGSRASSVSLSPLGVSGQLTAPHLDVAADVNEIRQREKHFVRNDSNALSASDKGGDGPSGRPQLVSQDKATFGHHIQRASESAILVSSTEDRSLAKASTGTAHEVDWPAIDTPMATRVPGAQDGAASGIRKCTSPLPRVTSEIGHNSISGPGRHSGGNSPKDSSISEPSSQTLKRKASKLLEVGTMPRPQKSLKVTLKVQSNAAGRDVEIATCPVILSTTSQNQGNQVVKTSPTDISEQNNHVYNRERESTTRANTSKTATSMLAQSAENWSLRVGNDGTANSILETGPVGDGIQGPIHRRRVTRIRGSMQVIRRKIARQIVEKCAGVVPYMSNTFWQAFVLLWQKEGRDGFPDARTIKQAVEPMCKSGEMKKMVFTFKSSTGLNVESQLLALPHMKSDDEIVCKMRQEVENVYPHSYAPPELELEPNSTISKIADKRLRIPIIPSQDIEYEETRVVTSHIPATVLRKDRPSGPRGRPRARLPPLQLGRRLGPVRSLLPTTTLLDGTNTGNRKYVLHYHETDEAGAPIRESVLRSESSSGSENELQDAVRHYHPNSTSNAGTGFASRALTQYNFISDANRHDAQQPPQGTTDKARWKRPRLYGHGAKSLSSLAAIPRSEPKLPFTAADSRIGPAEPGVIIWSQPNIYKDFPTSLPGLLDEIKKIWPRYAVDAKAEPLRFEQECKIIRAWENAAEGLFRRSSSFTTFMNYSTPTHFETESAAIPVNLDKMLFYFPGVPISVQSEGVNAVFRQRQAHRQVPKLGPRSKRASGNVGVKVPKEPRRRQSRRNTTTGAQRTDAGASTLQGLHGEVVDVTDLINGKHKKSRGPQTLRHITDDEIGIITLKTIILMTVAGGPEKRINWDLALVLFPGEDKSYLRDRWKTIRNKYRKDISALTHSFQEKFPDAYLRGEVPQVDFENLPNTDWWGILSWAESALEKQEFKEAFYLPAARRVLHSKHTLTYEEPHGIRETLVKHSNNTVPVREAAQAATPFAQSSSDLSKQHNSWASKIAASCPTFQTTAEFPEAVFVFARSYVLSAILTPQPSYDANHALQILCSLLSNREKSSNLVDATLRQLNGIKAIHQGEKHRKVLPGDDEEARVRKHGPGARFWCGIEDRRSVDLEMLQRAIYFKTTILDAVFHSQQDSGEAMQYVIDGGAYLTLQEGDMLCLLQLQARGRVRIRRTGKAPGNRYGVHHNYQTRNVDRDLLSFDIKIEPTNDQWVFGVVRLDGRPVVPGAQDYEATYQGALLKRPLIPIWMTLFGCLQAEVWNKVVACIIGVVSLRPGVDAAEIVSMCGPALALWEVDLVLCWLEEGGFICKTSTTQNVGWGRAAWQVNEWWWCSVDANTGNDKLRLDPASEHARQNFVPKSLDVLRPRSQHGAGSRLRPGKTSQTTADEAGENTDQPSLIATSQLPLDDGSSTALMAAGEADAISSMHPPGVRNVDVAEGGIDDFSQNVPPGGKEAQHVDVIEAGVVKARNTPAEAALHVQQPRVSTANPLEAGMAATCRQPFRGWKQPC